MSATTDALVAEMVADAERTLRRERSAFDAALAEVVEPDDLNERVLRRLIGDGRDAAVAEVLGMIEFAEAVHPELGERTRRFAAAVATVEVAEALAEGVAAGELHVRRNEAGQITFQKVDR